MSCYVLTQKGREKLLARLLEALAMLQTFKENNVWAAGDWATLLAISRELQIVHAMLWLIWDVHLEADQLHDEADAELKF
jgi:hypothetical protein